MPGRGKGRPGSTEMTRESVLLLSALCEEGATLSVEGVASRLEIDTGQARFLLDELLALSLGDDGYLPVTEEGDSVVLISSRGMRGRPLRLTRSETYALVTALDQAGIPEDDPLRRALADLTAQGVSDEEVERLLAANGAVSTGRTLTTCNRALVHRHPLAFSYQGSKDPSPRERTVVARGCREEEGLWYLDAIDVETGRRRTFRVDRMVGTHEVEADGAANSCKEAPDEAEPRRVEVAFTDPTCLYVLEWPDLEIVSRDGDSVRASIPYYGGSWLPRHLAACGAGVDVLDEEMRRLVDDIARRARRGA